MVNMEEKMGLELNTVIHKESARNFRERDYPLIEYI